MMMFLSIKRRLVREFGLDFADQAKVEIDASDEGIARATVARFSRGNVPMQHEFFQTPKQLEEERIASRKLKFD